MFLNLKRILMSEVDSGGGNGAAAPAATESVTEQPQAQGGATVTLSKAELDELVSSAAAKAAKEAHDKAFADARRTFTESKKNKTPKADDAGAPPAALSASEERLFLRGLDRELARLGIAPNSAQYARAERDLLADRPEDVASWAKDYFDGWGGAKPATQPTQTQAAAPAPKPATEHPISNRGAPPPAQTPLEEIDLFTATESDRAAFIRSKGPKAYVTLLQKQAKGRTVKFT